MGKNGARLFVWVDNINRGEIYHRNACWNWARSIFKTETFKRGMPQADVIEHIKREFNGKNARIVTSLKG